MFDEEIEYFEIGQKILNEPGPSWVESYNNPKNGVSVSIDAQEVPGYMSGRHTFKNIKLHEYTVGGVKDSNSLYYENSGVENLIPYMVQTELVNNWTSGLKSVKINRRIGHSRVLVTQHYAMPYPLNDRYCELTCQLINNLEVNGTLVFQNRSYDKIDNKGKKVFW